MTVVRIGRIHNDTAPIPDPDSLDIEQMQSVKALDPSSQLLRFMGSEAVIYMVLAQAVNSVLVVILQG